MRLFKNIASLVATISLVANTAFGTVIELDTIIVSNNANNTVTLSTNGTIALKNVDITQVMTNATLVPLASTNSGTEGMRLIGAVQGHNLYDLNRDISLRGMHRLSSFLFNATLAPASNLVVTWSSGDINDPINGTFSLLPGTNTLVNNAINFAYYNPAIPNIVQWTTGIRSPVSNTITLASFTASFGMIVQAFQADPIGDTPLAREDASYNIFPSLLTSGINAFATGTNLNNIAIASGTEYYDLGHQQFHNAFNLTNSGAILYYFGHTNSIPTMNITNYLPIRKWDMDGTNIANVTSTSNNWYRGLFLAPPGNNQIMWVLPTTSYSNQTLALAGSDPTIPAGMNSYIPQITAYIYCGTDTTLRTDSSYWVDRRFIILRQGSSATTSGGSGGGSSVPTLNQVLLAGNGTGGILPSGMGLPTTSDQAASKAYVDVSVNNINSSRAYVDPKGNDATAQLNSSIQPYQHIQSAINAAVSVATSTSRIVVTVSPGVYTENLTMKNYISVRGTAVEETILNGVITYPSTYNDIVMTEIGQITIMSSNSPSVIFDGGSDQAAMALRSCILIPQYYSNYFGKFMSVVTANRGIINLYPGNAFGLINNGTISNGYETIIEHTDDPSNIGLSTINVNGISGFFVTSNPNDDISELFTHGNSDAACVNTIQSSSFNIYLNTPGILYSNNIKLVSQTNAVGRCLLMSNFTRLWMNTTNNINLHMGYADHGTGDNVAIIRNNHIRVMSGSTSNIWFGAATTTNDSLRIYDTEIIQANAFNYYPMRYTNSGSAGNYYINTPHQNGDLLLGGVIDMSPINTISATLPTANHIKILVDASSSVVNPAFVDQYGNIIRIGRDSAFAVINAETNTLQIGEAVYIYTNLTSAMHWVKRAKADSLTTMPCAGIVMQVGGIASNAFGRVMRMGRTELPTYLNTTNFSSGQTLYISSTIAGGITNVDPNTIGAYSQSIGYCNIVGATNGQISVVLSKIDTLGNQIPSYYASTNFVVSISNGLQANINIANTNYQGQLIAVSNTVATSASNAQITANIALTNYLANLIAYSNALAIAMTNFDTAATNALWISVTNLNAANISINNIVLDSTRGNSNLYIIATNAQSLANIALTNYQANLNAYSNALNNTIIAETNRAIQAESGLQFQINSATNRILNIENQTSTWNIAVINATNAWVSRVSGMEGRTSTWNAAGTNYQGPLITATNGAFINGTNWVISQSYVTQTITNGLATTIFVTNLVTGTSNALQLSINIANTNYQGPLASSSSAGTNYANNIAISSSNYTGSISNNLYITMTNNDTSILAIANTATNWIAANSNKVNASITNNQTGVTLTGTFISAQPIFKANIGAINYSYAASSATLLPMTNAILVQGGTSFYSNSVSAWYPRVTSGIIMLHGIIRMDIGSGQSEKIDIYKNGAYFSTVAEHEFSTAAGNHNVLDAWNYTDTTTPTTNDYWQLYYTVSNTRTAQGQGTNNWWFGQVEP